MYALKQQVIMVLLPVRGRLVVKISQDRANRQDREVQAAQDLHQDNKVE
jgi:hypothetical protein